MSGSIKMTVNVSLCGSIPRSEMISFSSGPQQLNESFNSSLHSRKPDELVALAASSLARKVSDDIVVSNSQIVQPPSWAVPARGEVILEPVSESRHLHKSLDLTRQAVFRIGRSDISDLQLLHCASSRRHALLFHHPNGSCYVVDCGSAHGTYVNGIKVKSSVTSRGIVPQRVRKGALIRFGGQGAPSFILKSFSVSLNSLMQNLDGSQTITYKTNIVEDEPPKSLLQKKSDFSLDALVTLNTRLNSIGNISNLLPSKSSSSLAGARLRAHHREHSMDGLLEKRPMVSFDEENNEEPARKKLKPSIPTNCDQSNSIAFVSPSRQKPVLRFDYSSIKRPIVSPTPFADNIGTLNLATSVAKNILTVPLTLSSTNMKKRKSVKFCLVPQVFYPPTVTPESTSDDEEQY